MALFAAEQPSVPVKARVQGDLGYRDTKLIPGQKWKVHDIDRPRPRVVDPGTPGTQELASRPSDAIVLFDGKDMSKWKWPNEGWKVENGHLEVTRKGPSLVTNESFGDMQLHVEWTVPPGNQHAPANRAATAGSS